MHSYQMALMDTGFSSEHLRVCVKQMLRMRVAGLAVLTSEFDDEAFAFLRSSNTPSVFLDTGTPSQHLSNIRVDTKGGMFLAVKHLVDLGHRDILFVQNSQKSRTEPSLLSHQYRREGFVAAIRRYRNAGARAHFVDAPGPGASAGLAAIRSALRDDSFTAAIAITDTVALGIYRGLNSASLTIPHDVSVISFDNTYLSEFMNPPLTTIDISKRGLSKLAVEALCDQDKSQQPGRELKLETELIVRDSTSPPRLQGVRT